MNEFNIDEFWDRVKFLIKLNYTTQRELSENLGGHKLLLQHQINRKVNPNLSQLVNMAKLLNVSLDFLITGHDIISTDNEVERTKALAENIKRQLAIKDKQLSASHEARLSNKLEQENRLLRQKLEEIKNISNII